MTEALVSEVCRIVHGLPTRSWLMQWIDRARAMLHAVHGLSLPDPDRIDIGSVADTARLIQAIDAAMPRSAILQLIGPRHKALLPFLATRSLATRRSAGEYFLSLEDGSVGELARVATGCAPDEVCTHLFVQDAEHTLLEAFGRDRGEDVVWLSRRLPSAALRRFLEVVSDARPTALSRVPLQVVVQPRPRVAFTAISNSDQVIRLMSRRTETFDQGG